MFSFDSNGAISGFLPDLLDLLALETGLTITTEVADITVGPTEQYFWLLNYSQYAHLPTIDATVGSDLFRYLCKHVSEHPGC